MLLNVEDTSIHIRRYCALPAVPALPTLLVPEIFEAGIPSESIPSHPKLVILPLFQILGPHERHRKGQFCLQGVHRRSQCGQMHMQPIDGCWYPR